MEEPAATGPIGIFYAKIIKDDPANAAYSESFRKMFTSSEYGGATMMSAFIISGHWADGAGWRVDHYKGFALDPVDVFEAKLLNQWAAWAENHSRDPER
jgi:hypothetical protein